MRTHIHKARTTSVQSNAVPALYLHGDHGDHISSCHADATSVLSVFALLIERQGPTSLLFVEAKCVSCFQESIEMNSKLGHGDVFTLAYNIVNNFKQGGTAQI